MYCKNCGAQIPDDSRFCIHCGTKLFEDAPKISPRIYEMESPSFDDEPESYGNSETFKAANNPVPPVTDRPGMQPGFAGKPERTGRRHHTEHVKKDYVYGDFGADLTDRLREFQNDRYLDKIDRRQADPEKYARKDRRRGRAKKVWGLILLIIVVAWILGRIKVLLW